MLPLLPILSTSVVLLSLLITVSAAAYDFPVLKARVVDQANLLSSAVRAELEADLKAHEQATGNQIVVATLNTLAGGSIEDYAVELARHWGIGQKTKNNGVLLLIAPQERKMRIEVGYGLEGLLTDALCSLIIDRRLRPAFKKGDFAEGIKAGVAGITAVLNSQVPEDLKPSPLGSFTELVMPMLYIIFFITAVIAGFMPEKNRLYPTLFSAAIGMGITGILTASLLIGSIVGLFVFAILYLFKGAHSSGHFPSSGGGTRFDGGGFSGGGGSFGGGGASGSW